MFKKLKNLYRKINNLKMILKTWGIKFLFSIKINNNFLKSFSNSVKRISNVPSKFFSSKKNLTKKTNNSSKKKNFPKYGGKNTLKYNNNAIKSKKTKLNTKTKSSNLKILLLNLILLCVKKSKKMHKCFLKLSTSKWKAKT